MGDFYYQYNFDLLFHKFHLDNDSKVTHKVKYLLAWRPFQIIKSCLITRYDEIAHAAFVEPVCQTWLRK